MNGKDDQRAEVSRLRAEIARRRRAGKSFDDLALRLAVLDEVAQIRGVKMTPTQKIMNIRG